jgi:hypothetical protein
MPTLREHGPVHFDQVLVIIHQQFWAIAISLKYRVRFTRPELSGELHSELGPGRSRSRIIIGLHGNIAPVHFDNAVSNGQSKPGSFPICFVVKNGSKTFGGFSFEIPIPVSWIVNQMELSFPLMLTVNVPPSGMARRHC